MRFNKKWALFAFWLINSIFSGVLIALNVNTFWRMRAFMERLIGVKGLSKDVLESTEMAVNCACIIGLIAVIIFAIISFLLLFGRRQTWKFLTYGIALSAALYTAGITLLSALVIQSNHSFAHIAQEAKVWSHAAVHAYDATYIFGYISTALHTLFFFILFAAWNTLMPSGEPTGPLPDYDPSFKSKKDQELAATTPRPEAPATPVSGGEGALFTNPTYSGGSEQPLTKGPSGSMPGPVAPGSQQAGGASEQNISISFDEMGKTGQGKNWW